MAPMGVAFQGRMGLPVRYLPLSQFFLQQAEPDGSKKVIYGKVEPEPETPGEEEGEEAEEQTGFTGVANIPAIPVPIGSPGGGWEFIDFADPEEDEKKKEQARKRAKASGEAMSAAVGHLLRRLL